MPAKRKAASCKDSTATIDFEARICRIWLAVEKLRIYDPACCSDPAVAGFVQSEKFVESHGGKLGDISIYGQDQWAWGAHLRRAQRARRLRLRLKQPNQSKSTTRRLAVMNLAVLGFSANPGEVSTDTFFNDHHPDLKDRRGSAEVELLSRRDILGKSSSYKAKQWLN